MRPRLAYQPGRLPETLPDSSAGTLILKRASRLDAFSVLSQPDVANQPCSWQNNWHTRGQSVPVLSY
ncbi:MAG: hypothetical protein Q613_PSC00267G0002, partial [Propionibacterium sp. DORA_15]